MEIQYYIPKFGYCGLKIHRSKFQIKTRVHVGDQKRAARSQSQHTNSRSASRHKLNQLGVRTKKRRDEFKVQTVASLLHIYICCYLLAMEANIFYCSLAKPPPAPTLSLVYATATTRTARMAVAAMAKLVLLLVVLLQVSCVLTAAARTLPGEEWLPEAGGVVRAVVEMLVSSKSGGNGHGGTTCC